MVPKSALLSVFSEQSRKDHDVRELILLGLLLAMAAFVPLSIAGSQLLLAAATVLWSWQVLVVRRWRPRVLPFVWPLLFCVATTVAAVLNSGDPPNSATSLKKFALFLIPFLVVQVVRVEREAQALLEVLFLAGAASAARALWQYPDSEPLHRVSGFLGHWQTFAGQQMILIVLLVSLLLLARQRLWAYGFFGFVSSAGLLLSETRGAWIGAACGVLVLAFVRDKRLLPAVLLVLLAVFLIVPANLQQRVMSIVDPEMESNAARLNMWSTGWNMIVAHPWLGVGPNQITTLAYDYGGNPRYEPRFFTHLHNNYLQFAAERGIPGLIAWLWLIVVFFLDSRRLAFQGSTAQEIGVALGWGAVGALTALVLAGMVEFNLGDSEVLTTLLLVMGCVYALLPRGL